MLAESGVEGAVEEVEARACGRLGGVTGSPPKPPTSACN